MFATSTRPTVNITTWNIDPSHSTVDFAVKHMMIATVKGHLGTVNGTFRLNEANLANSYIEAIVDVTSLSTNDAKRDAHLLSADFFDVESFPTATFVSKKIEAKGTDKFHLVGDLTIRGTTKEVELSVEREGTFTDLYGNVKTAFSATTTINRKDFGLNWNVALESGGVLVGENVKLELNIQAAQQAADLAA